ncbi:MAG TPA: hypothetical protein VFL67_09145, partial [Mycobacterium sp.]|nr:hypothetical protein [Mycobacterium sp.]
AVVGAAMAVRLDVGLLVVVTTETVVMPVVFKLVHGSSCVVVGKQLRTRRARRMKSSHDLQSAPDQQKGAPPIAGPRVLQEDRFYRNLK